MKEYRYGTFRLADNLTPSLLRIFCKEGLSVIE